jgi:hypothetical protein
LSSSCIREGKTTHYNSIEDSLKQSETMGVKGAGVDEKKQEGGKGSSESGNMEAK